MPITVTDVTEAEMRLAALAESLYSGLLPMAVRDVWMAVDVDGIKLAVNAAGVTTRQTLEPGTFLIVQIEPAFALPTNGLYAFPVDDSIGGQTLVGKEQE